jgi:hypothetical protein
MRYPFDMSAAPNGPHRQLPLDQAGERLRAVIDDVARHGPIELTDDGETVAVIVAPGEFHEQTLSRPGLWDAIQKFRSEVDLDELDIESAMRDVRDRSPGRDIEL